MRLVVLLLLAATVGACAAPVPPRPLPPSTPAGLEAALRALVARHPEALVAVSVRDRATGTRLDVNGDSVVHAASTMKLPILVELYRRVAAGELRLSDTLRIENRFASLVDGSPYAIEVDSDDGLYARLGQTATLEDLAERMTSVSSNLAANLLLAHLGADRVQATLERLGGTHGMRVRRGVEDGKAFRAGLNNVATSHDLAEPLDRLAHGEAISKAADADVRAVLLGQRFNTMLPAGLPPDVPVAHKTGWITGHRHDAAIVLPSASDPVSVPYVLVVLTRGFATPEAADVAGAEVARIVHAALRPAR